ncbi:hypothetical protein [Vibrio cortegadensis]|uniref:Lipoprotein n=1 Tax=Vibrio cortegadensis TaxID=1328770 RepID=A0ABV4MC18_9VIBR|nr:hypothetical protein [Vibrio cortegadensis]MDN3699247.1 hypothetical protein [Vibrio cortegadensis]
MKYQIQITSLLLLAGCGEIVVEDGCFEPIEMNVNYLFKSESVRAIPLEGYGEEQFLRSHDIVGYVYENSRYSIVKHDASLKFTGRVFKSTPSWAERYLGGSSEHIMFEAVYEELNYVVFNHEPQSQKLPYLVERCHF